MDKIQIHCWNTGKSYQVKRRWPKKLCALCGHPMGEVCNEYGFTEGGWGVEKAHPNAKQPTKKEARKWFNDLPVANLPTSDWSDLFTKEIKL